MLEVDVHILVKKASFSFVKHTIEWYFMTPNGVRFFSWRG